MRDFLYKYPGLNPEEARIRHKIWLKEREHELKLLEALKRKNPFNDNEDEDFGSWDNSLYTGDGFPGHQGVVSDAAISGANLTFVYPDGSVKYSITDQFGRFETPIDFTKGDIIATGGIDTVTGLPFVGEFVIDADFFFRYSAITPITHIANYIWNNTDTQTPDEALDLVLNHFPDFMGISVNLTNNSKIFSNDPVKLTLEGVYGAKEVQAINTIIEVYTELIGNTEANFEEEVFDKKKKAYSEIAHSLLHRIVNENSLKYSLDIHDSNLNDNHKECCNILLNKAYSLIASYLEKDKHEATSSIQSLNLAVKSEWAKKALIMTNNENIDKDLLWKSIIHRNHKKLESSINLPDLSIPLFYL